MAETELGIVYPETENVLTPLAPHFAALADSADEAITAVRNSSAIPVANEAARGTQFPTPAQGNAVYRLDRGYVERFYDEYASSGNPGGKTPAGWYPDGTATLPAVLDQETGVQTIASTSAWSTLPYAGITLVLPAPAWVEVTLDAWLAVSGVSNDARADVVVSGATTVAAQSHGWGSVAWGGQGTTRASAHKILKLNTGTNTIRVAGFRTVVNSGTFTISQGHLWVNPQRWA